MFDPIFELSEFCLKACRMRLGQDHGGSTKCMVYQTTETSCASLNLQRLWVMFLFKVQTEYVLAGGGYEFKED